MPNPIKRLKERIERLRYLESYNINRINLLLNNAIGELNLMIEHEMSIFNDIRTEILIYKEKANPKRLKDLLDKFEMNVLEL